MKLIQTNRTQIIQPIRVDGNTATLSLKARPAAVVSFTDRLETQGNEWPLTCKGFTEAFYRRENYR